VNADDFGACSGVNQGIVETHERGIVTSASLMVDMPDSEEAAQLSRGSPALSVGLHAVMTRDEIDGLDPVSNYRVQVEEQMDAFKALMGRMPTHLDSHHHVHTRSHLLPAFRAVSRRYQIPLRAYSGVRYCSRFYGRWGGEAHPEQISVASLVEILEADTSEGVTELACHPGLPDPALVSSYSFERTLELETLCATPVREFLANSDIVLVDYSEVPRLIGASL
jgi:predicted glycoside hydrolase/deacetylase ChbG (UPF0249 family)